MRVALGALGVAAGCVFELDSDPFDGQVEAGHSCDEALDCDPGTRCNGEVCTPGCIDDDECDGTFACGVPWEERTGADGCFERCVYDDECKAGTLCQVGDCVVP
jgi:hypothetical protein